MRESDKYVTGLPWIDAHLDLAYLAVRGRDLTRPCPDPGRGVVSLPALRRAGVELVFGTIFTEPGEGGAGRDPQVYPAGGEPGFAEAAGLAQLEVYLRLEAAGEIAIVRRRADLDGSGARPQVLLLMEGADPIREPRDVARWHDAGLRVVGLTWSMGTRYAGGNARPGPLTGPGRELVAALDEAGIVHDASHLCDRALDELLELARGPVVASHSNCRALLRPEERHLRDDHIRAIGKRGGVVGLNLYSRFLVAAGRATPADCAAHVERVARLMGHRRGVGLGSDMDGGFEPGGLPEGLDHPERLEALAAALTASGWRPRDVEAFRRGNWRRFLERVLP